MRTPLVVLVLAAGVALFVPRPAVAGGFIGFSIGIPLPLPIVPVAPAPIYVPPPPVYAAPPLCHGYYAPAPRYGYYGGPYVPPVRYAPPPHGYGPPYGRAWGYRGRY